MTAKKTAIGDNSVSSARLRELVEKIEKLVEDRAEITSDIKAVMDAAGHDGFDKTMIREVLKARKLEKEEREEREALRELYFSSLGML